MKNKELLSTFIDQLKKPSEITIALPEKDKRIDNATKVLKELGLNRLFLHAAEVELTHPESGRKLRVKAPIPDNLKLVMEKLS